MKGTNTHKARMVISFFDSVKEQKRDSSSKLKTLVCVGNNTSAA